MWQQKLASGGRRYAVAINAHRGLCFPDAKVEGAVRLSDDRQKRGKRTAANISPSFEKRT